MHHKTRKKNGYSFKFCGLVLFMIHGGAKLKEYTSKLKHTPTKRIKNE